jgi:dUTP pyrophosphatase
MSNLSLEYWKVAEEVLEPRFATLSSACFDIHAWIKTGNKIKCYTPGNKEILVGIHGDFVLIKPGDRMLIPTGLIFKIPEDYSLRIHIRSSVAFKQGIFLANSEGIVDQDYFHETFIMLTNTSTQTVNLKNGDRIAQGELLKMTNYCLSQTYNKPEQITDRIGGIGSTGK